MAIDKILLIMEKKIKLGVFGFGCVGQGFIMYITIQGHQCRDKKDLYQAPG